jgi:hypothetical protein
MRIMDPWMSRALRAGTLLLTAALLATAPARAAESPSAPYWSVHLETHGSRDQALGALKALGEEPAARAEKRKSGWLVRVGAWAERAEADRALERLRGKRSEARVLQIENPVEWLLASGERLAPPGAPPAAAAAAAPAPGATAPAVAAAPPVPDAATLKDAAQRLDTAVRRWLTERGAARGDGYVYGMDVAPLLLYAAQRKDAALYDRLLAAAKPLVVEGGDEATRGFVLWRHKAGEAPEVSGATEALALARALWAGHRQFKRADDRALALRILDGYARHATTEGDTWMVRKYSAFGTKSYASLSVLPNYGPDFLDEAEAAASPKVRGLARRSYTLLQRAQTMPTRLLVPLVQPGINEVLPGVGVSIYAPNGVVALEDSCNAAEAAQRGVPQLARNVLDFATKADHRDANGRPFAYFHRKDGRPVGATVLSSTGVACLARLAAATRDRKALDALKAALVGDLLALADSTETAAPLYAAGPLLLAADDLNAL